jgi:hypothetical protein
MASPNEILTVLLTTIGLAFCVWHLLDAIGDYRLLGAAKINGSFRLIAIAAVRTAAVRCFILTTFFTTTIVGACLPTKPDLTSSLGMLWVLLNRWGVVVMALAIVFSAISDREARIRLLDFERRRERR